MSELEDMVRRIVREELLAIREERKEVWISQAKAFKMAGRGKVERAMSSGLVKWEKKDYNDKYSRVMIRKADILRIIEKPFIQ
jgi:tRNA U38,U39,U40 pseudouridine synthase TruA